MAVISVCLRRPRLLEIQLADLERVGHRVNCACGWGAGPYGPVTIWPTLPNGARQATTPGPLEREAAIELSFDHLRRRILARDWAACIGPEVEWSQVVAQDFMAMAEGS